LSTRGNSQAVGQADAARFAADAFFNGVLEWWEKQKNRTGRVRTSNIVSDHFTEELLKLSTSLMDLAKEEKSEEFEIELSAAAIKCHALAHGVRSWLDQGLAGQVYWIEVTPGRWSSPRITLASAPIDVGPALHEQLFSKVPTVILTSATLSV